jgi:hypothetical protein
VIVELQDCNVEAAAYFQLRQMNFFTFSGIIRIDLPLLLSVSPEKNGSIFDDRSGKYPPLKYRWLFA